MKIGGKVNLMEKCSQYRVKKKKKKIMVSGRSPFRKVTCCITSFNILNGQNCKDREYKGARGQELSGEMSSPKTDSEGELPGDDGAVMVLVQT